MSVKLSECFKSRSIGELGDETLVILCHPDDEGVVNNSGRAGAAKGPERILHYLGRMPSREMSPSVAVIQEDFLNLSLMERYEKSKELSLSLLKAGKRILSLGGGHDYAYPDFDSLYRQDGSHIINVDAHLDVRKLLPEKPTSGTPFFRLLEAHKKLKLTQWGLRSDCNSDEHIEYCRKRGVEMNSYKAGIPDLQDGPIGLSLCLDAIEGIRAVSAPAMLGLSAERVLDLVHRHSKKAKLMGIYESAPELDPHTEDSARLAAIFAYHYIHPGRSADESRLL